MDSSFDLDREINPMRFVKRVELTLYMNDYVMVDQNALSRSLRACGCVEMISLAMVGPGNLIRTGSLMDILTSKEVPKELLAGLTELKLQVSTLPFYRSQSNVQDLGALLFPRLSNLMKLRLEVIDDMTTELLDCILKGVGPDVGRSWPGRTSGSALSRSPRPPLKELVIIFNGELAPGVLTEFELVNALPMLERLKIHQKLKDPMKVTTCQRFVLVKFVPGNDHRLLKLSLDVPNLCVPPVELNAFLLSLPPQLLELGLPSIVFRCKNLFFGELVPKMANL